MADSHESRTIGVPLQNSYTDLVFHGFYLDKCIDLTEGFHAVAVVQPCLSRHF